MKRPMLTGTTQFEIQNQLRRLYYLIKKVTHIPSLRLDDFDQTELLNYLYPLQEQAKKVSFGVGSYERPVDLDNSGAYQGAVYSPTQNRVYFVPNGQGNRVNWHYIDCEISNYVEYLHGAIGVVRYAYNGGAYSPTQDRIYFAPFYQGQESDWHYVNCNTGEIVAYTHGATAFLGAYAGGVYSPTQNRIYFIPSFGQATHSEWHYIDCNSGDVVAYLHGQSITGSFSGGTYSPTDDRIYFNPVSQSTDYTYYIDCNDGTFNLDYQGLSMVGVPYSGGVYSPTQNRIYLVPYNQGPQEYWHYIDCNDGNLKAYLNNQIITVTGTYVGGVYDPVLNRIYFVPNFQSTQTDWHYVDCYNGDVVSYQHNIITAVNAFSSGSFSAKENRIYFAPYVSGSYWHYIQNYSDVRVSRNLMAGPIFNKS